MPAMQKGECRTIGCKRVAQVKGIVKGFCCSNCSMIPSEPHAQICNMIEEVGNAEVELGDNVILGYN